MSDHEKLRSDIPAYLASKLEGEARVAVERHLGECAECAALADSVLVMSEAIRAGGEEISDPHPDALALQRHALGERLADGERLARHLDTCAACALQAEFWRGRGSSASRGADRGAQPAIAASPEPAVRRDGSEGDPARRELPWRPALWLAVGLLLGAGLVFLTRC